LHTGKGQTPLYVTDIANCPNLPGLTMFPEDVRVLLLDGIHPSAAALLGKHSYTVETLHYTPAEDELIARLRGTRILGVQPAISVTAATLGRAPSLFAVGVFGMDTSKIDLDAAIEHGIVVFNAPFSGTRSMAELVLAEMIVLSRRLTEKNSRMHLGQWDKASAGAHEMRKRRLGIVGYGSVGSQVSVLAEALGMTVFYFDVADRLALGNARRCCSLAELLSAVDIVTLHVGEGPENHGLIGVAELARMRPGSLLLNLSNRFAVDHRALRAAIEADRVAGAAIDVFPAEPSTPTEGFRSELRGLPNVILTPRVGAATRDAQADIARFVSGKLHDFMASGASSLSTNAPGVAMPGQVPTGQRGARRLTLLHQNRLGVLAEVNAILSAHGANIEGQVLGTRGDIGYVITDVQGGDVGVAAHRIVALPATIRIRLTATGPLP
jgi:D-3-phosphoglycerate dehydrogenase / 2-oxoglutarate reductase